MADLDVTALLSDPDFTDLFAVTRRAETLDSKGRVVALRKSYPNVIGVVTPNDPSDLDRAADYDSQTKSLTVITQFQLRPATTGFKPDIVEWNGDRYLVRHVSQFSHFGAGFVEAECSSMDRMDNPVENNGQ
jgi:galactose-6-phosphate isomerase